MLIMMAMKSLKIRVFIRSHFGSRCLCRFPPFSAFSGGGRAWEGQGKGDGQKREIGNMVVPSHVRVAGGGGRGRGRSGTPHPNPPKKNLEVFVSLLTCGGRGLPPPPLRHAPPPPSRGGGALMPRSVRDPHPLRGPGQAWGCKSFNGHGIAMSM